MAYAYMLVRVTIDPTPGTFHTPESAVEVTQNLLSRSLPHGYNPVVRLWDIPEIITREQLDNHNEIARLRKKGQE